MFRPGAEPDNMVGDTPAGRRKVRRMAPPDPLEKAFNLRLAARVRHLRERQRHPSGKKWTQADMADTLGCTVEQYRKYEKRSPIPVHLIPRLARACGVSVEFVVTGREPAQLKAAG